MNSARRVPVGRIIRTHGLRGALKMIAYGETLGHLKPGAKLYLLAEADGGEDALTVRHSRPQGKHWVLQFAEIAEVDAAQEMVGKEVFVPEEALPPTAEGEYYYYQLIGLRVEGVDGRAFGVLRAIIDTGSNDVYVVKGDDREILIPAIAEVIREVDLQHGKMIVNPPEGLLDDL